MDANAPVVSIAEYRQRLDALEPPVQKLAEQVRTAEVKLGKDHADCVKLRAELRALVQQTFASRQDIQRAELTEFTRRLQRMQHSIETRQKIAEKIVDRRMEELLDPDASWDTATPPTLQNTNNDGRVVTATSDGTEISFIPWKAPKNAQPLSIDLTAWGEPVNGLRIALAVTDGPETKPRTQRIHLVINNMSNESIQLDNTGWADDFTMAMHVRRNSGEQVETRRPENDGRFAPFTGSYSLKSGETVVLATKLIGLADDSISDNSTDLLIADQRPQTNADGHRTWYLVGTSINVPGIPGNGAKFRLHTGNTALEFRETAGAKQTRGLPEKFHGDWKVEQLIVKGGDVDLSTILNPYLEITADHFVIPFDGNIRETLAYTLVPGTPTKVDLILEPSGSKARALGIVEVTEDTFKLCFREPADVNEPALTEADRPRTFGPESKLYMVQCRRTAVPASPPDSPPSHGTVSLEFPQGGATLSMVQREKRVIPGSSDSLFIQLSDITRGRVFVEINDSTGKHLLKSTPLQDMEFTEFKINDKVVYVQITEMENHLFGQDHCQVHFSFEKPAPTSESHGGNKGEAIPVQVSLTSNRTFRSGSGLISAVDRNRLPLNIPSGSETTIQLTDFSGRHGLELAVAIEPVTSDAGVFEALVHNHLSVHITNDDFDRFAKSEPITKVIYLPTGPSTSASEFEQILSWQLVPELDPVKVAEERGRVAAVIRMTPSHRTVMPIKDVAELEGKWRWLSWDFVSASDSEDRPFLDHPGFQQNRNPLHITNDGWIWNQPKRRGLSTTYDFGSFPQSVVLNDPVTPATTSDRRLIELSEDRLCIARFFATPGRPTLDEPFTSFDTPGLLIETYQRAGVVTATADDKNQVEISLGLSDDIKIGQKLTVTSGDQAIGTVEVITVERDSCAARTLDVLADRSIQKGDRIRIVGNSIYE